MLDPGDRFGLGKLVMAVYSVSVSDYEPLLTDGKQALRPDMLDGSCVIPPSLLAEARLESTEPGMEGTNGRA
eukprot:937231-Amorphochlora_amoeboformis.AAC.2